MRIRLNVQILSITLAIILASCSGATPTANPTATIQPTLTPEPTATKVPLERPPSLEGSRVSNVILFIGDGMGENHRLAATWISQGQDGLLAMDQMDNGGWSMTNTAWDQVTDSAAGATAIATGVKTANHRIGIDPRGRELTTILEQVIELGMATGLVTTVQMSHATPAAFASHVQSRDEVFEISRQMMAVGINVLLGGGENDFLPEGNEGCHPDPGKRKDGRNLIEEAVDIGYRFVCTAEELSLVDPTTTTHLLGLFSDEEMLREFNPSLSEMTEMAISILRQDPDGFFLMVEGGQIDWASHGWNAVDAMGDTLGLDEAVGVALEFVRTDPSTLIIVTADHETGGMKLKIRPEGSTGGRDEYEMPDGSVFKVSWSTSSHTDADVPTTGMGPGAELLEASFENTHIYEVMRTALWLP
jgi:alkaline phosphatase